LLIVGGHIALGLGSRRAGALRSGWAAGDRSYSIEAYDRRIDGDEVERLRLVAASTGAMNPKFRSPTTSRSSSAFVDAPGPA
jgi:hypothetical protein